MFDCADLTELPQIIFYGGVMMNKKQRLLLVLFYILSVAGLLSLIHLPDILSPKANTLDFRGYVESVEIDWNDSSAKIYASYIDSDVKAEISASTKISCTYMDGRAFPINSLKKGDMIDLNYKGHWGLDGDGVMKATAKWLTVCPIAK